MAKPKPQVSERQALRDKTRARRAALLARQEALFDLAASGYATETVAERFGIAPRAVRRAIDRAVAARRRDEPAHFVALQIARLHKALRAAEAALDRNDLRGVAGMVRIVAQLDKYHRPALAAPPTQPDLPALPAPTRTPLALTHAPIPALSGAEPAAKKETSFGALVVDILESLTGARV